MMCVCLFLRGRETLATEDAEKAEFLSALPLHWSVLDKTTSQGSLAQETRPKECWKKDYPLARLLFQGQLG